MPGQTALDDSAIVERAKNNLQRALNSTETVAIPQSDARWLAYSQWARQEIPLLRTVNEAVAFAQLRFGFESRATTRLRHRARLKAIREKLRREFPHADDHTTAFTESQFSARNTCLMSDGRLVSSQLLNLVRFHLTAVAHTPPADTVCEIGGGYGAPARIWMTSPVRRPKKYIIVDLPESLFFAEVFLRAHFGDRVSNVAETQHFDSAQIVLCAVPLISRLSQSPVDLVINTWSMQEMSDQWIDFYMNWLDNSGARFFYSFNAICRPIDQLGEVVNSYSPRPFSNWVGRMIGQPEDGGWQGHAVFERGATASTRAAAMTLFDSLCLGPISLAKLPRMIDCLRQIEDVRRTFVLLTRAIADLDPIIPKEFEYFCERIKDSAQLTPKEREAVLACSSQIAARRARGREFYLPGFISAATGAPVYRHWRTRASWLLAKTARTFRRAVPR
jgi:putative sugar O-methyltransferase